MDEKPFLFEFSEDDIKRQHQYMKKYIKYSKFITMWPVEGKPFWYHLVVWIVTINCILFLLTFFIGMAKEGPNMDGITEMIDFATVFVSGTFRYVYIYLRGEQYIRLVQLIHDNFIHYTFFPTKHKASLDKYYKIASRIILTYECFTYFWIIQVCITPIVKVLSDSPNVLVTNNLNVTESEWFLPMAVKVYVPFDYYKQPENFLFYFYQSLGFIFFGSVYLAVDSFWMMAIFLTVGQFQLIKDSIDCIMEVVNEDDVDNNHQLLEESKIQEIDRALKKCIEHHQFTRNFVQTMDNLFNPNILVDSLHAIISIAFILLGVTIALNNGDWNKGMYSLEYLTTSMSHMFIFNWLANQLAVKEEELAEAIYNISWHKCPTLKVKILLIIIQSRRPYKLTGGKMYRLSLEFFTATVKAIFSYFTFLLQLRNGKSMTPTTT